MITLIGLGTERGDMTLAAKDALDKSERIMARSERMCAFDALEGYDVETLDGVFLSSRNFDTLNRNLASAVMKAARGASVAYCVDGAVCDDEACKIILSKARDVRVCEGPSKAEKARCAARMGAGQVCSVSAYGVEGLKSCVAAVVYDVDDARAAELTKTRLTDIFGEETECSFVRGGRAERIRVYEIDRQAPYGPDCAVAVEDGDFFKKDRYDYEDLVRIIKLLRAPGGCPWDRAQTNESIKKNMIEEAYELADAVDRGDDDALMEEAGDVVLQGAFHAVMKEEQGAFSNSDMITELVKKLIFRHSHIFGTDKASDADSALGVWEKNKAVEKHFETIGEEVEAVSLSLPACMRAQKVQKRAAKSGMDFSSSVAASDRLAEEVREMIDAQMEGDEKKIEEECGDLLFSAVNCCRLAGADCESALADATKKFSDRFVRCERLVLSEGKDMRGMDELELDGYWKRAKDAQ